MKILKTYEELNFPAWALCALLYGDVSGLTEEEIKQVDTFTAEWSRVAKDSGGEYFGQETFGEPSFCHYPEFGMPCDCIELTVYIWGKQTKGANSMKLHTNSKEFMSRCKSYFLDSIDSSGYDENPQTDKEKFQFVLNCFASEYGHEIEWKGEQVAFANYLAGLPSCMTIEFYNWDIIKRAKLLGSLAENATEKEESAILENWFGFMAFKFLRIAEKEGAKLNIEGAE